jgi:hypothetical protein
MFKTLYQPTDEQRRTVTAMASCGIPQQAIASVLQIDPKTLRKHFFAELETAAARANAKVASTLFAKATSPAMSTNWRTSDIAEDKEKLGKKEIQRAFAATSERGTDWERLLN